VNIETLIESFHEHYKVRGWDNDFKLNKYSWLREYGESNFECVKTALYDWVDKQGGNFLKAPLPADIRGYYNQRMEKVRTKERVDHKPTGVYADIFKSSINFSLVTDNELKYTAEQILRFREQPFYNKPKDKCPMYKISQSIVTEYNRRFSREGITQ